MPTSNDAARTASPTACPDRSLFSQRSQRQFGLYLVGAGCLVVSSLITRKALARRLKVTYPRFFQPSNQRFVEIDGATEAAEALALATINVASAGLMITGGTLWALNISNMEDMRQKFGTRFRPDGTTIDVNAEKEAEKWISSVLEMMGKDTAAKEEKHDTKKEG